jgi:hypothetical protein
MSKTKKAKKYVKPENMQEKVNTRTVAKLHIHSRNDKDPIS